MPVFAVICPRLWPWPLSSRAYSTLSAGWAIGRPTWRPAASSSLGHRPVPQPRKRNAGAASVVVFGVGVAQRPVGAAEVGQLERVVPVHPDVHGRWRSAAVMRGYVEEGTIWTDNAAARLGL